LENVLLDANGNVKLSDLGLAVMKKPEGVRGYAGTPGYTAPEVVLSHYYDHHIDYFSFGVMVYRFLCGRKPYESRRRRRKDQRRQTDRKQKTSELDRNVVEMEPEFPNPYFTQVSRSLLKGLLCKNPDNRLGCNGIDEIKNHPWFDSIDFGLLEAGHAVAPFLPDIDEIYGESSHVSSKPPMDDKWAHVRVTDELNEALAGFPYVSAAAFQTEVVAVLESVMADRRASMHSGGGSGYYGDVLTDEHAQLMDGAIDFDKEVEASADAKSGCLAGCRPCLIM
jgi:serine/threonine protein kinase